MRYFQSFLFATGLALPVAVLAQGCPLERSAYKDMNGRGFVLEFAPAPGDSATVLYTVTIKHPKRGILFDFDFSYSQGIGESLLTPRGGGNTEFHRIHFFDEKLKSFDAEFAAPYAFVEGLGFADHYGKGELGSREPALGTPLWKFSQCKATQPDENSTETKSKEAGALSSAESVTDDGRIAAFGQIRDLGIKDGRRYLNIDYVEWLSREECERRVKSGALDPDEAECDLDFHIVNQNERIREFGVAEGVEIAIQRPSRFPETLSWDELSKIWRHREDDTRELWDGLWQIRRRDDKVERIEWFYTP